MSWVHHFVSPRNNEKVPSGRHQPMAMAMASILRTEQISGAQPPESFVEAFEALTRWPAPERRERREPGRWRFGRGHGGAENGWDGDVFWGSKLEALTISLAYIGISLVGGIVSYEWTGFRLRLQRCPSNPFPGVLQVGRWAVLKDTETFRITASLRGNVDVEWCRMM